MVVDGVLGPPRATPRLAPGVNKLAFPPIIIGEKLLKIWGWGRISTQGRVKNLVKTGRKPAYGRTITGRINMYESLGK